MSSHDNAPAMMRRKEFRCADGHLTDLPDAEWEGTAEGDPCPHFRFHDSLLLVGDTIRQGTCGQPLALQRRYDVDFTKD